MISEIHRSLSDQFHGLLSVEPSSADLTWIIGAAVGILFYLVVSFERRRPGPHIPGPRSFPFVGNFQFLWNLHRLLPYLLETTKRYGSVWTFRVPFQPRFIITSDPRNIEHILNKRFDIYEKGPDFHARLKDLLGEGIFNVDGDAWRVQRKIASRLFTVRNFRTNMVTVFIRHAQEVTHIFDTAGPQRPVDLFSIFNRFTLDSFGEIGLGYNFGSLKNEGHAFAKAFDCTQVHSMYRFFNPLWRLQKFYSPSEFAYQRALRVVNDFAIKIIREKKCLAASNGSENPGEVDPMSEFSGSDLLSLFLSRKSEVGGLISTEQGLRDLVVNFIIAGRDTTAQCLSWAMYMLITHPRVAERLREELTSLPEDEFPTYDTVPQLKYLNAVINETLRLFPSIPKDSKSCMQDDVLPDGHHVLRGDMIIFPAWVMGRLPELWGPDATVFRPERWLEMDEKPSAYKFLAFLAGPRICLGQNMAMLEASVLLIVLLRQYTFTLCDPDSVQPVYMSLSLPMRNGLHVYVTPRSHSSLSSSSSASSKQ